MFRFLVLLVLVLRRDTSYVCKGLKCLGLQRSKFSGVRTDSTNPDECYKPPFFDVLTSSVFKVYIMNMNLIHIDKIKKKVLFTYAFMLAITLSGQIYSCPSTGAFVMHMGHVKNNEAIQKSIEY